MHRSASTSRASDEFVINVSPQMMKGVSSPGLIKQPAIDQLPTYDHPISEVVSKKESSRLKTAENAVHFIPVVLIICAIILWLFSYPAVGGNKGTAVATRIEGLKLDVDANQTHTELTAKESEAEQLERIVDEADERSSRISI